MNSLTQRVNTIAVYGYNLYSLSKFIVCCAGIEDFPTADLPRVLEFGDLHLLDCQKRPLLY
jgi:hypothetical protein